MDKEMYSKVIIKVLFTKEDIILTSNKGDDECQDDVYS